MPSINVDNSTILKTIPINTFSVQTGQIASFASCSIVQYKGSEIILTVAHCTNEQRLIGINLGAYQGKPNVMFFQPLPISIMSIRTGAKIKLPFLKLFNQKYKTFKEIAYVKKDEDQYDMLYAKIPLGIQPLHNVITSSLFNQPKIKIPITFPCNITKTEKYKFYGLSFVGFANGMIHFNDVSANDLSFVKTIGNYHLFRTKQINGIIEGCSGAPILDSNGNIVSMVARYKKNMIWGVNLNLLNSVFEVSFGGLK